ncbi:hypothetical protein GH714_011378 [Hevea brasiliensis]|uniref:Mce/MlaD domain-containing protein n=1 Tax=Hevea brasiliensis TaxID=3981 RepID=A0A6A6LIB7_HEVBR|nr:hypothetical protein GH714_011378 [Hevea brasiliensis]
MVGNSLAPVSTCPVALSSSLIIVPPGSSSFLPRLPLRQRKRLMRVRAMSADAGHGQAASSSSSSEKKNPLAVVLEVPQSIWRQTLKPLSDFGFGRRSIWEGGVGLFLVAVAVLLALSLAWLRGFQLRSKFRKYVAVFEFAQACGICTGTPVRIRGVTVGNVIQVNPSLRSIEAVVEVEDDKIIIPRNSLIDESVSRQKIKGHQGVSLDALVGIFTRLGREMEEIGVSKSYSLAERVAAVIEEAKPLLTKIQEMAEDVQPLLSEVRDKGLLKEVENLTRSLTQASEDLRKAHTSIMTPENTELIQKSVYSLIFTLKNLENISSDILGFTGDEATRKNLKALIKSLSRML